MFVSMGVALFFEPSNGAIREGCRVHRRVVLPRDEQEVSARLLDRNRRHFDIRIARPLQCGLKCWCGRDFAVPLLRVLLGGLYVGDRIAVVGPRGFPVREFGPEDDGG